MAIEDAVKPISRTEHKAQELRQAALDWINGIREEYGLEALTELPKGQPRQAGSCVLARAAGGLSDGSCSQTGSGRTAFDEDGRPLPNGLNIGREGRIVNHPVPPIVWEFVERFDRGEFVDLIAE